MLRQWFTGRITWAGDPNSWFKRELGVLFIQVGLAVFTGLDKDFEPRILDTGFDTVQFENRLLENVLRVPVYKTVDMWIKDR